MMSAPKYKPQPLGNPLGPAFPNYQPPPAPKRTPPGNPIVPRPTHTGDQPYTPKRWPKVPGRNG